MYSSYYLDAAKKVKLILLDNRYENDEKKRYFAILKGLIFSKEKKYQEKCNLGKEQKKWLKHEVESSTAEYTIIGAGIQILPDDRPCEHFYPGTKKFVMSLVNSNTKMFYLSGDVHHAEFLVDECSQYVHGYKIREFVASGLTHGMGTARKNGFYIGAIVRWIAELLFPDTFTEYLDEDRTLRSRFYGNNFGLVEVYRDQVVWTIRDTNGSIIFSKVLREK